MRSSAVRGRGALGCILLVAAVSALTGCTSSDDLPPRDVHNPSRVRDLVAEQRSASSALLSWTAPGDDDTLGTAAAYEIRRAHYVITLSNWSRTTLVSGARPPSAAGLPESLLVGDLSDTVEYHFAMKSRDEAGNESPLSNDATFAVDIISPTAVTDLEATAVSDSSITLEWTSPGDDAHIGRAERYDLRVADSEITEANWGTAARVGRMPPPSPAGWTETKEVVGLEPDRVYWFGLKVFDDVGNASPLSNPATARTAD